MDFKMQLAGLNEFLAAIYGSETQLSTLLAELGFQPAQVEMLCNQHLEPLVSQLITEIRERLTRAEGGDRQFQIISRRYGLDNEPAQSLETIAKELGVSIQYARRLEAEALQRCRYKTALIQLSKHLQYAALAQLRKIAELPSKEHIADKLERLTNLQAAADLTRMDYEKKRAEIMKQIQGDLEALETEYQPLLETTEKNIEALTAEIKNEVLLHGESVQGGKFRASYVKGRVSWDSQGMGKYAESHPDVLQFRREGRPSVTLRVVEE
jgi:hypothetical protein